MMIRTLFMSLVLSLLCHSRASALELTFLTDTLSSIGVGTDSNGSNYKNQINLRTMRISHFPQRNNWSEVRGRVSVDLPYVLTHPQSPLVFIQSGLAGSGASGYNYFLMYQLSRAGYNVVSIPSQYYWRMSLASSTYLRPGETEQDLKDLARVYSAVRAQLVQNGGIHSSTKNFVLGVSYGGYNAIQMASRRLSDIQIEKFIALNPPLDLMYALRFLDQGFEQGVATLTRQRQDEVLGGLQSIMFNEYLSFEEKIRRVSQLYTSVEQAFALSTVFFDGVQEVYALSQLQEDQGVFKQMSLTDRLRVARRWTSQRYVNEILLPYYEQRGLSRSEVLRKTRLLNDVKIAHSRRNLLLIHAENDAIVNSSDLRQASRILGGSSSFVTERGGHLGNLHDPRVTARILEFFAR